MMKVGGNVRSKNGVRTLGAAKWWHSGFVDCCKVGLQELQSVQPAQSYCTCTIL